MNWMRPDFGLMTILAVAAAITPAFGQTAASTTQPPAKVAQSAASSPDFSGIWAHPYLTGFEPPASGPGPVRNKSRSPNGTGRFQQLVGDYSNPILKPEAAKIVKEHGDISLSGEGYPTPSNQCWPGGVPYVFWDFLMQMFQGPDRITMMYRQGDEVRHIRMNSPHPAQVAPSWYGDSVGHYEGDTLVIDTVGIKIGPFAMVDMYGTPHSPALHVVERYRLVDYDDAKDAMERNVKENTRAPAADFDPELPRQGVAAPFHRRGSRAFSRCRGRRPSPICPPVAHGPNRSAPKIPNGFRESTPPSRLWRSRIFEDHCPMFAQFSYPALPHGADQYLCGPIPVQASPSWAELQDQGEKGDPCAGHVA